MKLSLFCCIFLPLFSVSARGQTPAAPPALNSVAKPASLSRYAAEPTVVERLDTVYAMNADGTGWRQVTMVVRVQSESALKQLGVLLVPYQGSFEHVEISYARVRRPNGTVIETPVSTAIDMPDPVTREAPFIAI
jgi:hypothetical protein